MSGQCGSSRSRRRRVSRKMRGGMGYGFGGTIGTAGPVWDSSWGGEVTKSGTPIYDTADRPPVTGGRRHRKTRRRGGNDETGSEGSPSAPPAPQTPASFTGAPGAPQSTGDVITNAPATTPAGSSRRRKYRKASKKVKKYRRRRTMKGGMSVAHASAGFSGQGERGMANYTDVGSSQPFSNNVVPLS